MSKRKTFLTKLFGITLLEIAPTAFKSAKASAGVTPGFRWPERLKKRHPPWRVSCRLQLDFLTHQRQVLAYESLIPEIGIDGGDVRIL
jgi:hypothetical protein